MPAPTNSPRSAPRAPAWQISRWLNTAAPPTLAALRGRVVVVHAFQMLCPGCVAYGLPQATRMRQAFPESAVAVIGLHTVFEHHRVMTAAALAAFVHEYRLDFPIGIDTPDGADGVPLTMQAYGLRGTPSVLVIDADGYLRLNHFGRLDDLHIGALIGQLLAARDEAARDDRQGSVTARMTPSAGGCDAAGCGAG